MKTSVIEVQPAPVVNTKLLKKNYSPMIIRKYNRLCTWPLYIGIICDADLSDLDEVVSSFPFEGEENIQYIRNYVGELSDTIIKHYNGIKTDSVEGVAIFAYVDKMAVSSLSGDFMNHGMCRQEFYSILGMMPHI